jgi:hypothetical protein
MYARFCSTKDTPVRVRRIPKIATQKGATNDMILERGDFSIRAVDESK